MAKNQYEGLTEQQIQFADFYLDLNNGTKSAIKAGYSPKSAYSQASALLKNPKIVEYMAQQRREREQAVRNQLAKYAEDVVKELYRLAKEADSESVRAQAIKDIMDRAGYKPTDKIESKNEQSGKIQFSFVDPQGEE